jgi:hypothetical protein
MLKVAQERFIQDFTLIIRKKSIGYFFLFMDMDMDMDMDMI